MSYSQYVVDKMAHPALAEETLQDTDQCTRDEGIVNYITPVVNPDDSSTNSTGPASLQQVSRGILYGETPPQFMDAINATNNAMGNHTFLQFVEGMYQQYQNIDTHDIAKAGVSGPGKPLTHLHTLEQAFGHHDISRMREYRGPDTQAALAALGANGFCRDGRMALREGADLYTQAHEAAHGVQQAGLGSSLQLRGSIGEIGDKYEQHADAVAEKVMRGESVEGLLDQVVGEKATMVIPSPVTGSGPVQMMDPPKKDTTKKMQDTSEYTGKKPTALAPTQDLEETEVQSKPESTITSRDEFIAAVTSLVENASQTELRESHGALTTLSGYNQTGLNAVSDDLVPLFGIYSKSFMGKSRGGKIFPEEFSKVLIIEFNNQVSKNLKAKRKAKESEKKQVQTPAKEKTKEKKLKRSGEEQTEKEIRSVNDLPGLENMFLCRAINHLIMGELHELDSMVGDEGCQLRTPFILDMYRLAHKNMPDDAMALVSKYREKAQDEQICAFENLRLIERLRRPEVEAKIRYDRLKKSLDVARRAAGKSPVPMEVTALQREVEQANSEHEQKAKEYKQTLRSFKIPQTEMAYSGDYKDMITSITGKMGNNWMEYLTLTCSEGAIYWEDLLDDFGIAVGTNFHPVFSDQTLSKRKARQSELSKDYMVEVAARLLQNRGIDVHEEQRTTAYTMDKTGPKEKQKAVTMAKTRQNDILSQLLYSIQICSAVIPRQKANIQLIQCWDAMRVVFTHMYECGYPIIINLRRLVASPVATATGAAAPSWEYRSILCKTLFYESTPAGYKYVPEPDREQERQGAFCVTGYSMLRQGDETLGHVSTPLPDVASWVFEQDPEKFLRNFSATDILNLLQLGITKHPPLNVGAEGTRADALTEEMAKTSKRGDYRYDKKGADDAGGWRYADEVHAKILTELGDADLSEDAKTWLTAEYELTDKARGLIFPNACPVNLAGGGVKLNIKEEYQLLSGLSEAAGIQDLRYSVETEKGKTAKRLPGKTIPFGIVHVYASNFKHEDTISTQYAQRSKGKVAGEFQDLDSLR